ncbi:Abi family protein [Isobaculum melis]|uniref:Abortive infection bacteriophage resistance protein n=1 Tax=Isobaculum melis TaxID=142588 RepID=A0A1H9UEQ9_9LACT|nr:Abi family protein [Isobaculum melis]SES07936.1 Abortive infection bacteriophage resistance protein [Isobaculum melis]
MCDEKIFLSFDDQLDRLEERKLYIGTGKERENAKFTLQNVSYYVLVNGYKDIFIEQNTVTDNYQNATFVDLRDTFDFDKNLANIIFQYLLKIEDTFKTVLAHFTAQKFGHKEEDYLNISHYRRGKRIKDTYESGKMIEKLTRTCLVSCEPQIEHNRDAYDNIPPWVLTSALSLDTLLFWYKLSDSSIKIKIVDSFFYTIRDHEEVYLEDSERLELFLNCMMLIKEYRNRAAHGSRVMNHVTRHNLKKHLIPLYVKNNKILDKLFNSGYGNSDIFAVFIVITIMLSKRETVRSKFIEDVSAHFSGLEKENKILYLNIIDKINLPIDFKNILGNMI